MFYCYCYRYCFCCWCWCFRFDQKKATMNPNSFCNYNVIGIYPEHSGTFYCSGLQAQNTFISFILIYKQEKNPCGGTSFCPILYCFGVQHYD